MRKRECILDFSEPMVKVYPHHAVAFGIMQNNIYDVPALLTNYIQLVYDTEIDRMDFSIALDILSYLKDIPLLYCHHIGRELVCNKWKDFSDFLVDSIDTGYCVHCLIDTYHIAAYEKCYRKVHMSHNITVYGYSHKENCFYTGDSYVDGKFELRKVTMSEMDNAFLHTTENDWLDGIHLLKLKEDPYIGIGYEPVRMKKEVRNYLEGNASGEISLRENRRRVPENYVYGINVYEQLCTYLREIRAEEIEIDIRLISVLLEHKKVLKHIAKEMYRAGIFKDVEENTSKMENLIERTENVQSLMLKYNYTKKIDIIEDIISLLQELQALDYEAVELFEESILLFPRKLEYTNVDRESKATLKEKNARLQGNWDKQYGTEGYNIIGHSRVLPEYLSENNYLFCSEIYVLLRRKYANDTALKTPNNKKERLAAYYLRDTEFTIELNMNDDNQHTVTFYCMDYDQFGRAQSIEILDAKDGTVLCKDTIENFYHGVYMSYTIKGHVIVRFRKIEGPDAVLSGVFFD